MKTSLFIWILCLNIACNPPKKLKISLYSKHLTTKNLRIYYRHKPFTGTLFLLNKPLKDTLETTEYLNGVLHGTSKKWYPNGKLMEIRTYLKGVKHGKQISFWDNGYKRFQFIAQYDLCEGTLREWDQNGKIFHLGNYHKGQEKGLQKMWYENGKIRANYIIIKGKRYGLLGTKNCKNISENILDIR